MNLQDLKAWLEGQGFKTSRQSMSSTGVDWYAWRKTEAEPHCATNDKPPQIVITPYAFYQAPNTWESVEVDLTADSGHGWFRLKAYSIKLDELPDNLADIESRLIAAWRGLTNRPHQAV